VNLKDYGSFVMADIPGLIEGAHQGKGLGVEFLKHIQRTKLLLYLLDASSGDLKRDYQKLRREIELFDPTLHRRPKILVINKIDLLPQAGKMKIEDDDTPLCLISALTGKGLSDLLNVIGRKLEEMKQEAGEV
jgi:GTP-binding protein